MSAARVRICGATSWRPRGGRRRPKPGVKHRTRSGFAWNRATRPSVGCSARAGSVTRQAGRARRLHAWRSALCAERRSSRASPASKWPRKRRPLPSVWPNVEIAEKATSMACRSVSRSRSSRSLEPSIPPTCTWKPGGVRVRREAIRRRAPGWGPGQGVRQRRRRRHRGAVAGGRRTWAFSKAAPHPDGSTACLAALLGRRTGDMGTPGRNT